MYKWIPFAKKKRRLGKTYPPSDTKPEMKKTTFKKIPPDLKYRKRVMQGGIF